MSKTLANSGNNCSGGSSNDCGWCNSKTLYGVEDDLNRTTEDFIQEIINDNQCPATQPCAFDGQISNCIQSCVTSEKLSIISTVNLVPNDLAIVPDNLVANNIDLSDSIASFFIIPATVVFGGVYTITLNTPNNNGNKITILNLNPVTAIVNGIFNSPAFPLVQYQSVSVTSYQENWYISS